MAFQTKGPTAQWVMIFDHCVELLQRNGEQAAVITFTEWTKVLNFDIRTAPSAIKRANRELLERHGRTLVSVRGEGYRIDSPTGRMTLIAQQKKRRLGHYVQAGDLATNEPLALVTAEQAAQLSLEQRHLMEITHVIRGDDHISNTPRQILILEALGFTRPMYCHLPLILAPDRDDKL